MPRVIHFEIYAEEPQRAIRFYTSMFGWEFSKWPAKDTEGNIVGLMQSDAAAR